MNFNQPVTVISAPLWREQAALSRVTADKPANLQLVNTFLAMCHHFSSAHILKANSRKKH
jgi:hypothetical protein